MLTSQLINFTLYAFLKLIKTQVFHMIIVQVAGYTLVCAGNRNNTKRGGVCIYYINSISLKVLDIQLLNECINFEINIDGKACNFLCLYRSPSQTRGTFQKFANNLELTLHALTDDTPF